MWKCDASYKSARMVRRTRSIGEVVRNIGRTVAILNN
jgi:hypothetical protein